MAKGLRILHISTESTWRGGEQQLEYLIEELLEKGHEQHVICKSGSAAESKLNALGAKVHTFSSSKFPLRKALDVKKVCRANKIDLVHTHDSGAHSVAVFSAAFVNNDTPVVVSRRVDFPVKPNPLSRWKYNHPCIRRIICVSDEIKRITGKEIRNKDILKTVHSGVDLSKFNLTLKPLNTLREEYKIDLDLPLVGNVAALAPHKDYFTFLRTVKSLINQNVKAKFLIIGEGKLRSEIEAFIQDQKLAEHVILTGFRTDIPQILPQLDCFLFTSSTEGLGTSLIDAFACKVPVVGTNAGGAKELLEHNKTGYVIDVGDYLGLAKGVQKILSDQNFANSIREAAFEKAKLFSKENTATRTLKEYLAIL